MLSTLLDLCCLLFTLAMIPLSILGHELGHALAVIRLHHNGKPIILCLGGKMILDLKTGKYSYPPFSWRIRWPRLLLIVVPSVKIASGVTYAQEKMNAFQRFCMILAGPLASLGLALLWSAGAWVLFPTLILSQRDPTALWNQIGLRVFALCCIVAGYNGLAFLCNILPLPYGKNKSLPSQKISVAAVGSDGYQLLRLLLQLWREGMRRPSEKYDNG